VIQDVDWDLCSNTFSSIVQVSLDILEEFLVSILHLWRYVCVCVVNVFTNKQTNKQTNNRVKSTNQFCMCQNCKERERDTCMKLIFQCNTQHTNHTHKDKEIPDLYCNINNIFPFVRFTLCNDLIH
jgi:hypothetical protein